MSKFKVGDRVRRKDGKNWSSHLPHVGFPVVTVKIVDGTSIWAVETDTWLSENLIELVENTKWHPHHDLIIEWLENKDAVVEFETSSGKWYKVIGTPSWGLRDTYRITYPDRQKQTKIDEINQKIEELKQKVKELEEEQL